MKRLLVAAALALAVLFLPFAAFALDPVAPATVDVAGDTATVTTSAAGDDTTVITTPTGQPTTIEMPDTTTNVVLPVGNWVDQVTTAARDLAVTALGLALLWASRLLPEGIRQYINAERIKAVDQLLGRAVDSAFNAVRGATRGMKVEVNVGSELVAHGLQFAIDSGPAWLIDWMGGPEGIKKKLLAGRGIDLVPEATSDAVLAGMPRVAGKR